MSDEQPDSERRRVVDKKFSEIEKKLDDNTTMTQNNAIEISELRLEVASVNTKADTLLEMKQSFDNHLNVLCTWGKWTRRGIYGVLSLAAVLLPVLVAAKQLGWL